MVFKKGHTLNKGKRNPLFGRHHSSDTKLKMSLTKRGKICSEETKLKMSLAKSGKNHPRYGKKLSEEVKLKIGKGNKGKIISEETREKISLARLGKHNSPSTEIKKGDCGKYSIAWQGGKSFEPYTLDFNNRFKESIRARENYCCAICNKPQEDLGYRLHVHHIDYNKLNSFKQNCISLCRQHHLETNANRKQWTPFFQSLLKERYDYEYTEDQKIILDFTKSEEIK